MLSRVCTVLGLTMLLCTPLPAAAAQRGPAASGQRGPAAPPTDQMSPAQLHELFDAMLVMQAQKSLVLDDQQYGSFVTRLRALQETRRRNQLERGRIIAELQRMTNTRNPEAASEADLQMRLTALQELEARSAAELRRAYSGIDEVLSPVQQARFRVLEEQIERRKLELLSRARINNQQNRQQNARPAPRRPPGR